MYILLYLLFAVGLGVVLAHIIFTLTAGPHVSSFEKLLNDSGIIDTSCIRSTNQLDSKQGEHSK